MYFNIFWKCWNWPSYSREYFLYWLRWHLVVETSSLTVQKPEYELHSYQLWMRKHGGFRHWSFFSVPTDYENAPTSGLSIQNTVISGHSWQHTMSGPLLRMSWMINGHSGTGPCGCRNGIPLLRITSSRCLITCSIIWMAWCNLWPWRRHNGKKTYSLPWSLRSRSCPHIIQKLHLRQICLSFRRISLILSGSCDHLRSGTWEWIWLLKRRLLILPNTRRPSWSMWRMNTVLIIDVCRRVNRKAYQTTI